MLLAVEVMDPEPKMIFYLAAVILFVLSAIGYSKGKLSFMGAGLACFAFPSFWDQLAAV